MARRRRKSSAASLSRENSSIESESVKFGEDQSLITEERAVKIQYAKRKKAESITSIIVQISIVLVAFTLPLYTYYCFDHFHYHVTHFYANKLDNHHAQHTLGHKLLKDRSNLSGAFEWFRRSSDRGHPHSSYNLAAGHLSGYRTDVKKGEVRQLLRYAAKNGVPEAKHLLQNLCREKPKYCDL